MITKLLKIIKVQEGTTEGKCVAGPVLTRDQAKKSDKIHSLKVKEAIQVSTRLLNIKR